MTEDWKPSTRYEVLERKLVDVRQVKVQDKVTGAVISMTVFYEPPEDDDVAA